MGPYHIVLTHFPIALWTLAMAVILLRVLSGSIAGAYIRPEWRIGGVWTRGHAFGLNNFNGLLSTWGFAADPNRMQSKEAFWQKPAGTADRGSLRSILTTSVPPWIELVMACEEAFGIEIDDAQAEAVHTVGEMLALLQAAVAARNVAA